MPRTEKVTFKADTSHFQRGLKSMSSKAKSFAGTMTKISAIAIPLAGVAGGITLIDKALKAVDTSATFESLELQLANVLKSSKEASGVFKEIKKFSGSTPFQVGDITQGVTALAMANKGLGTNKELWLEVGNTSAKAGRTFAEVSKQVGKFLSATDSANGSIATPLESLSADMGVISPAQKDLLIGLKKTGATAQELKDTFRQIMQENDGNMKRLSSTWNGLKSTLADNKDLMMSAFGNGIIKSLKPIIVDITNKLKEWTPILEEWGKKVAEVVKLLWLAMTGDNGKGLEIFSLGLKIAGKAFLSVMWEGMTKLANKFGEVLGEAKDKALWGASNTLLETVTLGFYDSSDPYPTARKGNPYQGKDDIDRLKHLIEMERIKNFDERNAKLENDMIVESGSAGKKSDLSVIVKGLTTKISRLDFGDIKDKLKEKSSTLFDGAKTFLKDARHKIDVEGFTGNSNLLRPISDLTTHGGGGVYSMTGTQRHEQQMLNSTKNIERSLSNIERNQNIQSGGSRFN